jgi:hypothetical protein
LVRELILRQYKERKIRLKRIIVQLVIGQIIEQVWEKKHKVLRYTGKVYSTLSHKGNANESIIQILPISVIMAINKKSNSTKC